MVIRGTGLAGLPIQRPANQNESIIMTKKIARKPASHVKVGDFVLFTDEALSSGDCGYVTQFPKPPRVKKIKMSDSELYPFEAVLDVNIKKVKPVNTHWLRVVSKPVKAEKATCPIKKGDFVLLNLGTLKDGIEQFKKPREVVGVKPTARAESSLWDVTVSGSNAPYFHDHLVVVDKKTDAKSYTAPTDAWPWPTAASMAATQAKIGAPAPFKFQVGDTVLLSESFLKTAKVKQYSHARKVAKVDTDAGEGCDLIEMYEDGAHYNATSLVLCKRAVPDEEPVGNPKNEPELQFKQLDLLDVFSLSGEPAFTYAMKVGNSAAIVGMALDENQRVAYTPTMRKERIKQTAVVNLLSRFAPPTTTN